MIVAIAGGHGKIALLLERLLADRADTGRGLIRDPAQTSDLEAAGAGPGSGPARKETMDYGGAAKLIDAAKAAGVARYVIVSAMGAADPPASEEDTFAVYLRAKARADDELRASGLDFTVVRPGALTDDPPTGGVRIAERLDRGAVSRADVAAVLLAVLDDDATIGASFDLVGGEQPVAEALAGLRG